MEDRYIIKDGKRLKMGYTTGSCATATSAACLEMILSRREISYVNIRLPRGEIVAFDLHEVQLFDNEATCCVVKDGGDDPDATHGIKIFARVSLCIQDGIEITGGEGVGFVTVKGLKCPVGTYAINPVPRKMIIENLSLIASKFKYTGGIRVEIYVPDGKKVAEKTFNARLGILDGISILGTTGIVEPMSEKALLDTIKIMIDKRFLQNRQDILISPGNYGREYCKNYLGIDIDKGIKCSNYIGETLDYVAYKGYDRVLLVGHIGKLVKIALAIMNTHSRMGDGRMEVLALYGTIHSKKPEIAGEIMKCLTTDSALDILKEYGVLDDVMDTIIEKIIYNIGYRCKNEFEIGVIIFSSENEILASSKNASEFVKLFKE